MSSNHSSQKAPDQRSKSCETACSSNLSCFFQKRKPVNPLANSLRSSLSRSTTNSVRQRVLSAKLLKLKSVQNQLNDTNYHLAEVIRENQALKTLQKRQDKALSKYEGTNAELPRLIQSHEEEIRFLTDKNKTLRRNLRELNEQLKYRNDEAFALHEQLKHFEKLDKDRNLLEREKLADELVDMKTKLSKADSEIVLLNRKLTLESKTSKQRLNAEILKHKQCRKELSEAFNEINRLSKLLDTNGKKRLGSLSQKQSSSMLLLSQSALDAIPVTDVKLEPLIHLPKDDTQIQVLKPYKGILKCPSENIKARLSAEAKPKDEEEINLDKMSISGSDSSNDKEAKISRPNSSLKLEKIEMDLHNSIKKVQTHNHNDEFNQHLSEYCLKAIDSVKGYNSVIESHKANLEHAKHETDKIMQKFEEADGLDKKLKNGNLQFYDNTDLTDDNLDFVAQILNDEADFQKKYKDKSREPPVGSNDKKKLLATLRAIDNGDSVESYESGTQNQNKLIEELFAD